MGVKKLLQYTPGGRKYHSGFLSSNREQERIAVDAAGLLFQCATIHEDTYRQHNYLPSLAHFHKLVICWLTVLGWNVTVVFDGLENPDKAPERARRSREQAIPDDEDEAATDAPAAPNLPRIRNDPVYIAMAMKICKALGKQGLSIQSIVAPREADSQLAKTFLDDGGPTLIMTGDSDILLYGSQRTMIVKGWISEVFRFVSMREDDMDGFVLHSVAENTYPESTKIFLQTYVQQGRSTLLLMLHAAINGCDYTDDACGLPGCGEKTYLSVLEKYGLPEAPTLTVASLAADINAKGCCRDMTEADIVAYLQHVVDCFSKALYYDSSFNACRLDGTAVDTATSVQQRRNHALGPVNPRTGVPFSPSDQAMLDGFEVHNLAHQSRVSSQLTAAMLPPGKSDPDQCNVHQLKVMVSHRNGNTVSEGGKTIQKADMVKSARGYLSLDKIRPGLVPVINSSADTSGSYMTAPAKWKNRTPVPTRVKDVLSADFMDRPEYKLLKTEMTSALSLLESGKFITDFDEIASVSPEITPSFIYQNFSHIGESVTQKNIGTALQRVLEQHELKYHAICLSPTRDGMYLFSLQQASMKKDASSKDKKEQGSMAEFQTYLVFMSLIVQPTEVSVDGHALGKVVAIKSSYCAACTAGMGSCIHTTKAVWQQYHHWGEDRMTPRPSTISLCQWINKSGPENRSTMACHELHLQQMPNTIEDAERRVRNDTYRNATHGVSGRYNCYENDEKRKRALDKGRFSMNRPCVRMLFDELTLLSCDKKNGDN